ncbi:MAG: hypothetical protein H0T54_07020 [Geodermatophilaceae bacterium]|nr:hypothetical protein [Geodermatophilaceae bacterium]
MGSGALLAILVALWFVVLVPMVVTRGDLAATPAEPMRVLRRRSDSRAMSRNAMSSEDPQMGKRANHGHQAENMLTEPIPVLPRRIPGATLRQEMPPVPESEVRATAKKPVADSTAPEKPARPEVDIRGRRQRMLLGLVAVAVLFALFAAFWQPVLWWPHVVLDLAVFSYTVFLRLEAQREQDRQERRRARAAARVTLPEDRTQRLIRKQMQYQEHVTAVSGNQAISLDDDDPSFAEMPTWNPNSEPVAEAPAWHERKAV